MKTLEASRLRVADLDRALGRLAELGARMVFPKPVIATQATWPAACPLSEKALEAELRSIRDAVAGIGDQATALLDRLPDPPEYEHEDLDDVPPSVYCHLYGVVALLAQDTIGEMTDVLDRALDETSQTLWDAWLARRVPAGSALRQLVLPPGASEEAAE
ncbi:MAG: hypothetical protein AAF657_20930 [Acidobacteriota bacterium]